MKKSKFLKKSLAMLLALMLVVAMIPLSASAAEVFPNLTSMYIDNNPVSLDTDGQTFKADISITATDVKLRLATDSLSVAGGGTADLRLTREDSSDHPSVLVSDTDVDNDIASGGSKVNLTTWGVSSGSGEGSTVTITMEMVGSDNQTTKEYKVVLTRRNVGVSTDLVSAKPGKGVYKADVYNSSRTVELTVARNAMSQGDQALFTVTTADKATIGNSTDTNKATVTPATNTVQVDANKQTFLVTSQSEGNKTLWTVIVKEVDALVSFSVNGVEGVITDESDDGINVPDTVTVTLPKSVAYDELGYALTDVRLPINFGTYGNSTTVDIAGSDYKVGEKVSFGNLSTTGYSEDLKISAAGYDDLQTYTLKVELEDDTDSTITSAIVDDQSATIDGTKVSAVLPFTKADGTTPTDLDYVTVLLYTKNTVQSISGFEKTDSNVDGVQEWCVDNNDSNTTFDKTTTMDLNTPVIATVKAQDGSVTNYTISASISEDKTTASLSAIYLKDVDGNSYTGEIKGNTITFTVPYLTLDVSDWKIFATPNSGAFVTAFDGVSTTVTVNSGNTPASAMGLTTLTTGFEANKGTISAVNLNDKNVKNDYTVIINLETAKTNGKTLTSTLKVSAQTTDPDSTENDKVYNRITTENTVAAKVESGKAVTDNTGTITLNPPYSLSDTALTLGSKVWNILTEFGTNNGAVAFLAKENSGAYESAEPLSVLQNNKKTFDSTLLPLTDAVDKYHVVVLPEDKARAVLVDDDGEISATEASAGTVYTISEDPTVASSLANLTSMTVKGTELSVSSKDENSVITGTIPWSATTDDETDSSKAMFVSFTTSPYAILTVDGTDADKRYYSDGDTDGNGEADTVGEDNQKLLFVRNDDKDHTVSVYTYDDSNASPGPGKNPPVALANNKIVVMAEDRLVGTNSIGTYTFQLTWADANTEATFTSFKIGNSTGVITGSGTKGNIAVTVPYGTDLKGLVPTFTTSSGATVTMSGTTNAVESGKTTLNFTNPVALLVTSEDGKRTAEYTVTVKVADQFTDVQPGDWFYENVMRAVELGIASGKGNGIFDPYGKITRRDFAIMLAQAMGQSNDGEAVSPFVDVADDDYGVVSIAFLYEKGITVGDANGNFNPNSNITRQEVAIMMAKAFGATGTTDEVFTDDAKIASWAKSYVYAAKAAGLMNGDVDGSFRPNDSFTRAEAASAMVNAIDK